MRILVLQLARFGDIYQSWPAIKALRRLNPEAEVHVLVRHRFREALVGLEGVRVHTWATAEILEPICRDGDERSALECLDKKLADLRDLNFDKIVNLSFSPMSSYVTDALAQEHSQVSGYTRFADGYLNIPDDASAYFYAQGEIGKHNRFHITQIFGLVAGCDLAPCDFRAFEDIKPRASRVIVHLGASQDIRLYPAELWVEAIKAAIGEDEEWWLIGSGDERGLADTVQAQVARPNLKNLVGEMKLPELMRAMADAKLFIGCDSAPAQIASLTQTPVLQISSQTANFWCTGPTSAGSRVIYATELANIRPAQISLEARAMMNGEAPAGPCAERKGALAPYELHHLEFDDDFSWRLVEAIYTQTDYPEAECEADWLAFQRLFELAELALQQLAVFAHPEKGRTSALILQGIDEMLKEIPKLNPRIEPLVEWFETERLRIPPGQAEDTLARTQKLFGDLQTVSSLYRRFEEPAKEGARAIDLARRCLPAIREFRIASVQDDFQSLLSALHELSRHSTKVGENEWSKMLGGLNEALGRRDMIEVADQLEYILIPALS